MGKQLLDEKDYLTISQEAWDVALQPQLQNVQTEKARQINEIYEQLRADYTALEQLIVISANKTLNSTSNNILYKREYTTTLSNGKEIQRYEYTTQDVKIQNIFIRSTKNLYKLRTLITGEKIYFLENINGQQLVVEQEDWLNNLTANSSAITLLESSIKSVKTTELQQSSIFSDLTQKYHIEEDLIQDAGNFHYPADIDYITEDEHYKKASRDVEVYAYWRTAKNKQRQMFLLWQDQIPYNLGELYEAAIERFEQVAQLGTEISQKFLAQLNSNTPLRAIFGSFSGLSKYTKQGRSVAGLKEGDIRTSEGYQVQIKRGNAKIASLTQVYNNMSRVINILSKLTDKQNFSNTQDQLKMNVVHQFAHLYSSNKQLDEELKKQLQQLPFLGEIIS